MIFNVCKTLALFNFFTVVIFARKHHLEVHDDVREYIPITNFGFYERGIFQVEVANLSFNQETLNENKRVGFSLEKIANLYTYKSHQPKTCKLENSMADNVSSWKIFFLLDFASSRVHLVCSEDMKDVLIYNDTEEITFEGPGKREITDSVLFKPNHLTPKGEAVNSSISTSKKRKYEANLDPSLGVKCRNANLTMTRHKDLYSFSFAIFISSKMEEGLYRFSFYNCVNYAAKALSSVTMTLKIEAKNYGNYLSAGQIPLPALYALMSIMFFFSACFWFFILKNSEHPVFKIHYLMGILVVIKSLSLLFHAINYHFIQIKGEHMKTWAVMYYIMHLLKGALLFIVLALIGSGWAFIKHILSSKEKKIFMIVIPLQIIANVATIIIEETEESNSERVTWMQLLFLIDFLCCVAILLPVVWSIRHLQEASQTSGKAAISLSKLKLFRHFYIMVVCYIYFTRIVVYLLQITVTYQYEWLDGMFRELATFVFFVTTGYKFRPATNNPYFAVDTDDLEMDTCLTTTGLTETVTKVNQKRSSASTRLSMEIYEDDEEIDLLRVNESSHELD